MKIYLGAVYNNDVEECNSIRGQFWCGGGGGGVGGGGWWVYFPGGELMAVSVTGGGVIYGVVSHRDPETPQGLTNPPHARGN